MSWGVVYTAPREEGRAKENLERQEYEVFLPLMRLKGRGGGVEPMFSRYLFCKVGRYWSPVLGTRGVVGMIMEGDSPAYVRPRVIVELRARADEEGIVELEPFRHGARVRVRSGGGSGVGGLMGVYAGMTRRDRCAVMMTWMGREVRAEVKVKDVELAG